MHHPFMTTTALTRSPTEITNIVAGIGWQMLAMIIITTAHLTMITNIAMIQVIIILAHNSMVVNGDGGSDIRGGMVIAIIKFISGIIMISIKGGMIKIICQGICCGI